MVGVGRNDVIGICLDGSSMQHHTVQDSAVRTESFGIACTIGGIGVAEIINLVTRNQSKTAEHLKKFHCNRLPSEKA